MTGDTQAADGRERFRALDGLRGVAALLVVLLHVEWPNHLTSNKFVQNGYIAVDLFFILSGLVISSNYLPRITNLKDTKRFLGLRLFRLYPLHLAMLFAFVGLECAKLAARHVFGIAPGAQPPFTGDDSFGALVANLFLLNGLHVLATPSWNGPSWSISCELAAYSVFAIVVLKGLVRSRLFFPVVCVMAGVGYAVVTIEWGTLDVRADWGIVRCLAGFFLGMLICRFKGRNMLNESPTLVWGGEVAVMIAIVLVMCFASGPLLVFVIPLFVIVVALLQSDRGPVARLLISPGAQFLGRISYSIYMVHSFLVVCLLITLKRVFVLPMALNPIREAPIVLLNPWIGDLLVLGIVVAVVAAASLTYVVIEEPGRLFGRRLFSGSRNRPSVARVPEMIVTKRDLRGGCVRPSSANP
jgi:peptidoglycan/LPS O-acetylase OafA/YrhL